MSSTLQALLNYTKNTVEADVTWVGLRDNVLAALYHPEMNLKDVMTVCLTAYEVAAAEPRFELAYRHIPMRNLLVEPLSLLANPWTRNQYPDRMTVDQFYNMILERMMVELRLTRVDWCKAWYKGEQDEMPVL